MLYELLPEEYRDLDQASLFVAEETFTGHSDCVNYSASVAPDFDSSSQRYQLSGRRKVIPAGLTQPPLAVEVNGTPHALIVDPQLKTRKLDPTDDLYDTDESAFPKYWFTVEIDSDTEAETIFFTSGHGSVTEVPSLGSTIRVGYFLGELDLILQILDSMILDTKALIDAFPNLYHPERMPEKFLNHALHLLGWNVSGINVDDLPVTTKRKLVGSAVAIFKDKGTRRGMISLVRLLTGLEVQVFGNFPEETWALGHPQSPTVTEESGSSATATLTASISDVDAATGRPVRITYTGSGVTAQQLDHLGDDVAGDDAQAEFSFTLGTAMVFQGVSYTISDATPTAGDSWLITFDTADGWHLTGSQSVAYTERSEDKTVDIDFLDLHPGHALARSERSGSSILGYSKPKVEITEILHGSNSYAPRAITDTLSGDITIRFTYDPPDDDGAYVPDKGSVLYLEYSIDGGYTWERATQVRGPHTDSTKIARYDASGTFQAYDGAIAQLSGGYWTNAGAADVEDADDALSPDGYHEIVWDSLSEGVATTRSERGVKFRINPWGDEKSWWGDGDETGDFVLNNSSGPDQPTDVRDFHGVTRLGAPSRYRWSWTLGCSRLGSLAIGPVNLDEEPDLFTFRVYVLKGAALTDTETRQLCRIIEWAKPEWSHFNLVVDEEVSHPDHWLLGTSELGSTTTL